MADRTSPLELVPDVRVPPGALLQRALERLRSRRGTVAYFGASTTLQREGYRTRLHEALCIDLGHAHRQVNAAIGGVGSLSGLFFIDEFVLAHHADLCFIEFTIADAGGLTPPDLLADALGEIVRRLRRGGCEPCFLHLLRTDRPMSGTVAIYDHVAENHRVGTIDLRAGMAALIESGEPVLRDAAHTTVAGGLLVGDSIVAALAALPPVLAPRSEPIALEGRFARARLIPAQARDLRLPEDSAAGRFRLVQPYLSVPVGNGVERTFDGELAGVALIVGPRAGVLRVSVGERVERILTWDNDCHYDRLSTTVFAEPLPAHRPITIEPTDDEVDHTGARRALEPGARRPKLLKLVGYMTS